MKLLLAVICVGAFYWLQSFIYNRLWNRNLSVSIHFSDDVIREGDRCELCEVVANDKRLPLNVLQVKFALTRTFRFDEKENGAVSDQYYRNDFFRVGSRRKITRHHRFTAERRGFYTITGLDVIGRDFMLIHTYVESMQSPTTITVLPKRIPEEDLPDAVTNITGELISKIRYMEDPFEFRGIREYEPYDPLSGVNWKVTARAGELMVNTYHSTFSQDVCILLNTDTHSLSGADRLREEAIRIAASYAAVLISRHIHVSLISNGKDITKGTKTEVLPGSDISHIRTIEIALARINTDETPESFEALVRDLTKRVGDFTTYIFISNSRKPDLCDAYAELHKQAKGLYWFIPEYRNSEIDEKVLSMPDVFRWELRERV